MGSYEECRGECQFLKNTMIATAWWIFAVFCCFSVMSNSLRPCGVQHARSLCPSPSPGACPNSCPLIWWCHPTISSSVTPVSPSAFSLSQHQGLFFFPSGGQSIVASASILPMEYSGLVSFRMDWLDLLAAQGNLKSLLQYHSSKASILWL